MLHVSSYSNFSEKCPKKRCPGSGFVGKDCKCWCKGPNIRTPAIYCDTKQPVSGGNSIGPRPTQPPVTNTGDFHVNCPYWAKMGQCQSNPRYMLTYCKKSCSNVNGGGGGSKEVMSFKWTSILIFIGSVSVTVLNSLKRKWRLSNVQVVC